MIKRDEITDALDQQVNSKRIEEVDDCLEPADQFRLSIAVSAKRQADALERIANAFDQQSVSGNVLHWLEQIALAVNAGCGR